MTQQAPSDVMPGLPQGIRPWAALWSMIIGFFMLMVDTLIVAVANPTIEDKLNTSLTSTIWVTSAYALAIAVPLLVAGRLGDRFGQKRIFMIGMTIFTLGSLGCGLSGTITMLIVMRVIQGFGGSLMTPQTQAIIVRVFPPSKRGAPMGIWGAVSGLAMLVAPLLGGFLVDHFGWEMIFIVNVPVGVVGLVLAQIFVPVLPTTRPKFDWIGLVLSGLGLMGLVYGIQEGATNNWGTLWGGPFNVWECIIAGAVLLVAFVLWEIYGTRAPLIPMSMFRHRDFAISSAGIAMSGFAVTAMPIPLLYYTQIARGYSAQGSAMFTIPMAVLTGILSPLVGAKLIHKISARYLTSFGFVVWALGIWWYVAYLTPTQKMLPWLLFPAAVIGIGGAFVWSPMAVAAVRQLPAHEAGAGTGIYNATRQVGTVIGSAAVTTLMTNRITANLTEGFASLPKSVASSIHINTNSDPTRWLSNASPAEKTWFVHYFSPAMAQSLWLPIAACVVGVLICIFLSTHASRRRSADAGNLTQ